MGHGEHLPPEKNFAPLTRVIWTKIQKQTNKQTNKHKTKHKQTKAKVVKMWFFYIWIVNTSKNVLPTYPSPPHKTTTNKQTNTHKKQKTKQK